MMRAYSAAILVAVLGGCDQPVAMVDSGPRQDGGADAASTSPCARDADCSDGLFCTGQERCMPGVAGADTRGCVTFAVPCTAEVCDEATDTCTECSEPDMDGDSYASEACGGDDCDDTRGDVFLGGREICDAAGINEDCIDETLGTDADGDGAYDPACCFQPDDGPLRCGTDCDDGDNAIRPGASERCNGVDDDCDGMIDEGFECVQSQVVSGTNACGREGTRRCSETCTWLDASFARAESASSCDYCDDSGAGLGEEIPFATLMNHRTEVDSGWTTHGDARILFTTPASWMIADGVNHRGAVFAPSPIQIGYGTTYVQARVDTVARNTGGCPPPTYVCSVLRGGWALVILPGSPSSFIGTAMPPVPSVAGMAVEWHFSSLWPDCTGLLCASSADEVVLEELLPTGAPRVIGRTTEIAGDQDGPMGATVPQVIWVEITPDDPRTTPDESAVGVVGPIGTGLFCANDSSAMSCGVTFVPGRAVHIGIAAGTSGSGDIGVFATGLTITRSGLCGP